MELKEAIYTRRSTRNYKSKFVNDEIINELIYAGINAPSAMNIQPWAFSVIQDRTLLQQLSDEAKEYLLDTLESRPYLESYRATFNDPEFNIFYNAPALLTIYAKQEGLNSAGDCTLAAQNVMLMAHSMGLGTCWIGFAQTFLNDPIIKERLGVPHNYTIIAPIIFGYPAKESGYVQKNDPSILFWK